LAVELATRGGDVVLADLQLDLAKKVASDICAAGGEATAMAVGVTDFSALEQVVHQAVQRTGRLGYLSIEKQSRLSCKPMTYRLAQRSVLVDKSFWMQYPR
jgi:NAD(P)-dependent dehydrogenase (short-subunit alcohol dehydrogenase family)